jgi:hypothetical protein
MHNRIRIRKKSRFPRKKFGFQSQCGNMNRNKQSQCTNMNRNKQRSCQRNNRELQATL